jgi:hypothetical protein
VLWTTPAAQRYVVGVVEPGARLVRDDTSNRSDVLPYRGGHHDRTDGATWAA